MTEHHHIDFTRVFDILSYQQKKYPQGKALNGKYHDGWKSFSIEEVIRQADQASCWLIINGYQKGDRVAVIPKMGSPEWLIIDFACQQAGLILVPIHPTASVEETTFIINETEAKICITADAELRSKIRSLEDSSSCKKIFHLEPGADGNLLSLTNQITITHYSAELETRKSQILPSDLLAILYTSGTSGTPK